MRFSLFLVASVFLPIIVLSQPAVRLQSATDREMDDTTLAVGEIIYITDGMSEDESVSLRVGDGRTAGGRHVGDPWMLRAPTKHLLDRSEYALALSGNALYTNGIFRLLADRSASSTSAGNVGALSITADIPIAAVSYSQSIRNTVITQTPDDFAATSYTNTVISAEETGSLFPMDVDFYAHISNVVVYAWDGSHLLGQTNDVKHAAMLVRDPLGDFEPVNRGWHNTQMSGHRGDDWSAHAATNAVDMSWHPLWLSPYAYLVATSGTDTCYMYRDNPYSDPREMMTISADNDTITILSYSYTSTSVVMWADAAAPYSSTPVIQRSTNLVSGAWTNLTDSTSTYPTVSYVADASGMRYQAYRCSATFGAADSGYFRLSADVDTDASQEDKLNFNGVLGTDFLQLDPQPTFPSWGTTGTVVWITSGSTNKPYAFDGSAWQPFW